MWWRSCICTTHFLPSLPTPVSLYPHFIITGTKPDKSEELSHVDFPRDGRWTCCAPFMFLVAKCVYRCWVLTHLAPSHPHSDTRWKESGHLNFIFDDLQARMVERQPLTLAFYHQLPAEHNHLKWEQYAMRKKNHFWDVCTDSRSKISHQFGHFLSASSLSPPFPSSSFNALFNCCLFLLWTHCGYFLPYLDIQ